MYEEEVIEKYRLSFDFNHKCIFFAEKEQNVGEGVSPTIENIVENEATHKVILLNKVGQRLDGKEHRIPKSPKEGENKEDILNSKKNGDYYIKQSMEAKDKLKSLMKYQMDLEKNGSLSGSESQITSNIEEELFLLPIACLHQAKVLDKLQFALGPKKKMKAPLKEKFENLKGKLEEKMKEETHTIENHRSKLALFRELTSLTETYLLTCFVLAKAGISITRHFNLCVDLYWKEKQRWEERRIEFESKARKLHHLCEEGATKMNRIMPGYGKRVSSYLDDINITQRGEIVQKTEQTIKNRLRSFSDEELFQNAISDYSLYAEIGLEEKELGKSLFAFFNEWEEIDINQQSRNFNNHLQKSLSDLSVYFRKIMAEDSKLSCEINKATENTLAFYKLVNNCEGPRADYEISADNLLEEMAKYEDCKRETERRDLFKQKINEQIQKLKLHIEDQIEKEMKSREIFLENTSKKYKIKTGIWPFLQQTKIAPPNLCYLKDGTISISEMKLNIDESHQRDMTASIISNSSGSELTNSLYQSVIQVNESPNRNKPEDILKKKIKSFDATCKIDMSSSKLGKILEGSNELITDYIENTSNCDIEDTCEIMKRGNHYSREIIVRLSKLQKINSKYNVKICNIHPGDRIMVMKYRPTYKFWNVAFHDTCIYVLDNETQEYLRNNLAPHVCSAILTVVESKIDDFKQYHGCHILNASIIN